MHNRDEACFLLMSKFGQNINTRCTIFGMIHEHINWVAIMYPHQCLGRPVIFLGYAFGPLHLNQCQSYHNIMSMPWQE
jgi:hypothetical protein